MVEFYTEADRDSFHPSMWEEEREKRQQIQFSFPDVPDQQVSVVCKSIINDCTGAYEL